MKRKVALVILDTLASYWQITNENDNAEVIRTMAPLEALAHGTETAIWVIHHDRKGGGTDGESIRGGSGLFGKVDQALMLRRVDGSRPTRRKLIREGRFNELSAPALLLDRHNGRYLSLGTPNDAATAHVHAAILRTLRHGPLNMKQLVKRTAMNRKKLDSRLARLIKKGRVSRSGSGAKGDPYIWKLSKGDKS